MENKDKIEYCKFISETHRKLFNNRKQYEWRIFLSILTFYALAIATKFNTNVIINFIFCGIFNLVLWLICSYFFMMIHLANNKNKSYAQNAENLIVNIITGDENLDLKKMDKNYSLPDWLNNLIPERLKSGTGGHWDWIAKSIMLALFAIASTYILSLDSCKMPRCKALSNNHGSVLVDVRSTSKIDNNVADGQMQINKKNLTKQSTRPDLPPKGDVKSGR